jgi:hypothetical protein
MESSVEKIIGFSIVNDTIRIKIILLRDFYFYKKDDILEKNIISKFGNTYDFEELLIKNIQIIDKNVKYTLRFIKKDNILKIMVVYVKNITEKQCKQDEEEDYLTDVDDEQVNAYSNTRVFFKNLFIL